VILGTSAMRRNAIASRAQSSCWPISGRTRWGDIEMAMTLREAARRAERDVDVHVLLAAGVLRRNADGKIEFPFDAVHVD